MDRIPANTHFALRPFGIVRGFLCLALILGALGACTIEELQTAQEALRVGQGVQDLEIGGQELREQDARAREQEARAYQEELRAMDMEQQLASPPPGAADPYPVVQGAPAEQYDDAAPPPTAGAQVEIVTVSRCDLPIYEHRSKFVVEAWAVPDRFFNIGEPLGLQMRSSASSYLSLYHVGTSCKVTRLLNNVPMTATEITDFPLQGSGIEIVVKPPTGDEGFYFIASRNRLAFLAQSDVLGGAGNIASLDLSPSQFYDRLDQIRSRINPDDISMETLITSIVQN